MSRTPTPQHPMHLSPAALRAIQQRSQVVRQQLAQRRADRAAAAPQPARQEG